MNGIIEFLCSATVVQLVEHLLAKEKVAGSSPVRRSFMISTKELSLRELRHIYERRAQKRVLRLLNSRSSIGAVQATYNIAVGHFADNLGYSRAVLREARNWLSDHQRR